MTAFRRLLMALCFILSATAAHAVCSGPGGVPFNCTKGTSPQLTDLVLGGSVTNQPGQTVAWNWGQIQALFGVGTGLPLASTGQLYGGSGTTGVANIVGIGSGCSLSGGTLSCTGGGAPAILVEGGAAAKISAMAAPPGTLPGTGIPNVALQLPGDTSQDYAAPINSLLQMPAPESGAGFSVFVDGGPEGTAGAGGGAVVISGGSSNGGAPGQLILTGGEQLGTGPTPLTNLSGSNNLGAGGAGGEVVVQGGQGGPNGNGGDLELSGGAPNNGSTGSGVGGNVDIEIEQNPGNPGIHINGATGNVTIDEQLTVDNGLVLGTAAPTAASGAATCTKSNCGVTSEALTGATSYTLTLTDPFITANSILQVTAWSSTGEPALVAGIACASGSATISFVLNPALTGTVQMNVTVNN